MSLEQTISLFMMVRFKKILILLGFRYIWRLAWKVRLFFKGRFMMRSIEAYVSRPVINYYLAEESLFRSMYLCFIGVFFNHQDIIEFRVYSDKEIAVNLWNRARYKQALLSFVYQERARCALVKFHAWDDHVFFFFLCIRSIGCMGHLDSFIKRKILTQDNRPYYVLAPEQEIVNREFLNYWSSYIEIVTDPNDIAKLSVYQPIESDWNWVIPEDYRRTSVCKKVFYSHYAMADIQGRWHQEGREPLLKLTKLHQAAVAEQRDRWGLQAEDWFVCLHVRSAGYYSVEDDMSQSHRNTPVEDFYPLINAVVERGGWVIRMGHPSAPRLDKRQFQHPDRVIDYAHKSNRSSVLDVGLSASCRLFITTSTGLHAVARSFGVPSLHLNYQLIKGIPYYPNSLFMPCFYYSYRKNRVLTIEEVFARLAYADSQFLLDIHKVALKRIDPKDMMLGLDEALLNLPNHCISNNENAFNRLVEKYDMGYNGRIPQAFMEKYRDILGLS